MTVNIDSKTRLLGLLGNPSRHSLSPLIQNYFLSHYRINCVYLTFEPPVNGLKMAFGSAKNLNFAGLNITMPFKEEAFKLVDKNYGAAAFIKSINTVKFSNKNKNVHAYGFSTDGDGVIKSFVDKKISLDGKNCLVLGAGGAARSATFAILQKNIGKIFIYDIIYKKALQLAQDLKNNLNLVPITMHNKHNKNNIKKELSFSELEKNNKFESISKKISVIGDLKSIEEDFNLIDLIINCTPAGMDTDNFINLLPVPDYWNLKEKCIFDMVYKPVNTKFINKAEKEGAAVIIKGTDMLINQAVFSFKIWFDIMPEEKIIKQVREKVLRAI